MAGITGIVLKRPVKDFGKAKFNKSLNQMMGKLVYDRLQESSTYCHENVFIGNSVPLSSKQNDHYIKDKNLPYHIIVDGLVFISEDEKRTLESIYKIKTFYNDYHYLPLLYDHYQSDFIHHLTGWYNIFIHCEETNENLLVNDRLGYLPLYYYDNKEYFIFSSKIESLLASELLENIEFDEITIAEHLFFNYPLSDNTYIKNIYTLPGASVVSLNYPVFNLVHYWDIDELFVETALNKRQSIEAVNQGLKYSLDKILKTTQGKINFSLTGGWDSRVVLSCLLTEYAHRLNTYSFGAMGVDDIFVPSLIAEEENLKYTPYILDQYYLDHHFITDATDTIMLSNGTRNYRRTHYIHSIKQIAGVSPYLITGIFGDEVFKIGKPQGGEVISKNAVSYIESGFNVNKMLQQFKASNIAAIFNISQNEIIEAFGNRLNMLSSKFMSYKTTGEQYFAFRFTLNLRKYFGNEVNSYNDFVYCHSPFIDHDFLKTFSETLYFGSRYNFVIPSLKWKAQSSWLYYQITKRNHYNLTKYQSSRGFSMRDTNTIGGIPKIILYKLFRKRNKSKVDGFNTSNTDSLFYSLLGNGNLLQEYTVFRKIENNSIINNAADLNSLIFWQNMINARYLQ